MHLPRRRRFLPLALVVMLAAGSGIPAAAAAPGEPAPAAPFREPAPAARTTEPAAVSPVRAAAKLARLVTNPARPGSGPAARPIPEGTVVPAAIEVPAAPVHAESKVEASSAAYRGRNHVWIPSLGISRDIEFFPCSRKKAPGHRVYRWGCAGSNNVYLFAHAASLFQPLHDLYVRGGLRKGMKVVYADDSGRVRTYAVTFWRVVRPDGDIAWAFAGQARPSLTLQTCVGANSSHRLVVRLVAVG